MHPSEPFPHFVDDYLAYLYEVLPSQASLDGVHLHDDLLEDFEPPGDRGTRPRPRRLRPPASADRLRRRCRPPRRSSTPSSRANIEARMHELETVRTWERNPQVYADALGTSLASQALFAYAPEAGARPPRSSRSCGRCRGSFRRRATTSRSVPGIFVKIGLETWRGALKFIETDLPRAFSDARRPAYPRRPGRHVDGSRARDRRLHRLPREPTWRSARRRRSAWGASNFEQKLKLEEGITLSADRLLAIALRELHEVQEEFRVVAGRLNGGDPVAAWRAAKEQHPEPGTLVRGGAGAVARSSREFLQRQSIVTLPDAEPVVVAPSPEFYRWAFASMWTPGPFESKPSRAYYYLTDVDRGWPPERQKEHMRDFNLPTLWNISIHEVYPGHFLHFQHLRQVESKVRKSTLLRAGVVRRRVGALLRADDDGGRLPPRRHDAQARPARRSAGSPGAVRRRASACTAKTCRSSRGCAFSGTKRFSRKRPRAGRPNAAPSIPRYLVYSVGKLMMLKLRRDYKEQQGGKFSLRAFHDAVLAQGNAPFWAHRRLLLGRQPRTRSWSKRCRFTNTSATRAASGSS